MTMALFIGGVADGQWHVVPANRTTYQMMRKVSSVPWAVVAKASSMMSFDTYRKETLKTSKKTFLFFLVDSMTLEEGIDRLLRQYRSEPREKS